MKTKSKTHWFRNTLIVLIVCGLIGTVLAAVLFQSEDNKTYAGASLQFSFRGAADGKAPNGYPFDVNGVTTDEVLNAALEATGLTDKYTAEQLRGNLNITGIYPETIAEQMTRYISLLDGGTDNQARLSDYHATQYSVVLYNGFDPSISSGKLTELLDQILTAYRSYFAKNYAANLSKESPIKELTSYDYAQQLEAISENVDQHMRYALEMQELAPDFLAGGKSFGDIAARYETLKDDIDRVQASVTLNAVSKDRLRLQQRYEMEIRSQEIQLSALKNELKKVEAQVSAYDKDGIIYLSANGALNRIGTDASATYDSLVTSRKTISDKIAKINATIAMYELKLADIQGTAVTDEASEEEGAAAETHVQSEEEIAKIQESTEKKIAALVTKKNAVVNDFAVMLNAYSNQEINEKMVAVTNLKYNAPSLISGAFIVKAIKTAGPLCAVGFMVCMVLLIISRRKEEKAQKA